MDSRCKVRKKNLNVQIFKEKSFNLYFRPVCIFELYRCKFSFGKIHIRECEIQWTYSCMVNGSTLINIHKVLVNQTLFSAHHADSNPET